MKLIEKYIGTWGRYQAYFYVLMCFPFALGGANMMLFNFTGGIPKTRCYLPGVDDLTNGGNRTIFNSPYLVGRINQIYDKPEKFGGNLIYCNYWPVTIVKSDNETWTSMQSHESWKNENFNPVAPNVAAIERSYSCNGSYVFDQSQYRTSLVTDLGMVCEDNWKRSFASTCYMFGYLIGTASAGLLSDRYGRKPVFLVFSLLGTLNCHLVILTINFPMLCVLHILGGVFFSGNYLAAFVMVRELIVGKNGTLCGVWVEGMFTVGYVYVGICAYFIRQWKWLQFAVSVLTLGLVPYICLVPESIRWLIANGRKEEAKRLILKAASHNNRPVLNPSQLEYDIDKFVIVDKTTSVRELFTHGRHLAVMTLIIFFCWFATSMAYYGVSLNVSHFPGNPYLIYILSGLVQLPGYAMAVPLMQKIGRRWSNALFFGIGGVSLIITCFVPKSAAWATIVLVMISKLGIAATFAVMYNYSAELFPTVARTSGVGLASSISGIASMSAPQIYLLGQYTAGWAPFLVYGLIAIAAACLNMFLPETLGKPLPESIQDGVLVASKRWGVSGVDVDESLKKVNINSLENATVPLV